MASHIVLNDRSHGFHGFTMRRALMEESCLTVLKPLLENLMTIVVSMSISEQNLETSNHQTSNSKPIHFIFLSDFVQKISRGIRFQLTGPGTHTWKSYLNVIIAVHDVTAFGNYTKFGISSLVLSHFCGSIYVHIILHLITFNWEKSRIDYRTSSSYISDLDVTVFHYIYQFLTMETTYEYTRYLTTTV